MYARIYMYKRIDFAILCSLLSLYIFFLSAKNTRCNRLNEKCCLNEKKAGPRSRIYANSCMKVRESWRGRTAGTAGKCGKSRCFDAISMEIERGCRRSSSPAAFRRLDSRRANRMQKRKWKSVNARIIELWKRRRIKVWEIRYRYSQIS